MSKQLAEAYEAAAKRADEWPADHYQYWGRRGSRWTKHAPTRRQLRGLWG